jgi:hypothetical protein
MAAGYARITDRVLNVPVTERILYPPHIHSVVCKPVLEPAHLYPASVKVQASRRSPTTSLAR